MKHVLGAVFGLTGGVVGAGVGRAAYGFLGGLGWLPDPKASPRLAGFVSDAVLVAGVIPGALLGGALGHMFGAVEVIKKA
jgi:hypothetical protein